MILMTSLLIQVLVTPPRATDDLLRINSDSTDFYIIAQSDEPESAPEIPESSNLIGIVVIGLSIIFLTKKN